MKNNLLKTLVITSFLISFSQALAASNNGYTTAANVYTGSSSRTWFGAGVAHVLAQWKKERTTPKASTTEPAAEAWEDSMSEEATAN